MAVYLPPTCNYTMEGGCIRTDGTVKKKMSGTTLGGILGVSPFTSPFRIACDLLGLCREDISNKPAVKTGQELEPRIISYLGETREDIGVFLSADAVFQKREGDHDSWVSDFDDDYFAGHVDGIVMNEDGDFILEIKTSANLASWENGVPEYYKMQVGLYNQYITKKDHAYVGLGTVDQKTYANPMSWEPNEQTVALFKLDLDMDDFEENVLAKAREWYDTYIANGVTPEYNPNDPRDVEMYKHLSLLTSDINDIRSDIDEYNDVCAKIASIEQENNILYAKKETLKESLKDYLDNHNLTELRSETGRVTVRLSTSVRRGIDKKLMRDAGLNPEDFMTETISKTFTMKANKE